jgi:plastocyanin
MVPSLESPGRPRSLRVWTPRGVGLALILCTAIAAAGCGGKARSPAATEEESGPSQPTKGDSRTAEKKPAKTATKSPGKSAAKAAEDKPAEKSDQAEKHASAPVRSVSGGGTITLVDRGCVSFEPHWTTIRVGQSLTFHSELKKSVTVHVTPGVFDRDEYVVEPKKYVHTGPAQEPGDHGMWSLPAACQAAPHGVQGAGPGVTVEDR